MLRRLWMVLAAALLGGTLLAGCQGTTPPPPDNTSTTATVDGYTRAKRATEALPGKIKQKGGARLG